MMSIIPSLAMTLFLWGRRASFIKKIVPLVLFLFFVPSLAHAQSESDSVNTRATGHVIKIQQEKIVEEDGGKEINQILEVAITSGPYENKTVLAENNNKNSAVSGGQKFQAGDNVIVMMSSNENGEAIFNVVDYDRTGTLFYLFAFFFVITVVIGKGKGVISFIGMGLSFAIIIYFVLPQLLAGNDPFIVAIIASFIIIPLTFYLVHGFNKKTTAAVIGTILTLFIVGLASNIAIEAGHLSGFSSEEASYLDMEKPGSLNIQGLLLAGIIIGLLGILDDITISQAAIVYKLDEVSPQLTFKDLYSKAMDVGRDHIASVVNTLVLVYASAALPLLLLLVKNPAPIQEIMNEEFMAEEIIRTLVASTGIVIAVPITTFLTACIIKKMNSKK